MFFKVVTFETMFSGNALSGLNEFNFKLFFILNSFWIILSPRNLYFSWALSSRAGVTAATSTSFFFHVPFGAFSHGFSYPGLFALTTEKLSPPSAPFRSSCSKSGHYALDPRGSQHKDSKTTDHVKHWKLWSSHHIFYHSQSQGFILQGGPHISVDLVSTCRSWSAPTLQGHHRSSSNTLLCLCIFISAASV